MKPQGKSIFIVVVLILVLCERQLQWNLSKADTIDAKNYRDVRFIEIKILLDFSLFYFN